MSRLPVVSGHECIRALKAVGYIVIRQRGSYVILWRETLPARVVVPLHDELDRGTLRAIIRQAGISVDQFVALLQSL